MKRALIGVIALVVALHWGHAHAAVAAQCGLPDAKPLWIEYSEGSVGFRQAIFAKPGIIAATSGSAVRPRYAAAAPRLSTGG